VGLHADGHQGNSICPDPTTARGRPTSRRTVGSGAATGFPKHPMTKAQNLSKHTGPTREKFPGCDNQIHSRNARLATPALDVGNGGGGGGGDQPGGRQRPIGPPFRGRVGGFEPPAFWGDTPQPAYFDKRGARRFDFLATENRATPSGDGTGIFPNRSESQGAEREFDFGKNNKTAPRGFCIFPDQVFEGALGTRELGTGQNGQKRRHGPRNWARAFLISHSDQGGAFSHSATAGQKGPAQSPGREELGYYFRYGWWENCRNSSYPGPEVRRLRKKGLRGEGGADFGQRWCALVRFTGRSGPELAIWGPQLLGDAAQFRAIQCRCLFFDPGSACPRGPWAAPPGRYLPVPRDLRFPPHTGRPKSGPGFRWRSILQTKRGQTRAREPGRGKPSPGNPHKN